MIHPEKAWEILMILEGFPDTVKDDQLHGA